MRVAEWGVAGGRRLGRAVAIVCLLCALPCAEAEAAPDDLLIIANRSVDAKTITRAALKQVFLRQRSRFAGMHVVPVNARDRTTPRADFRARVLKMTRAEELRYWQEYRIRHGGRPPAEFRNVLKAVFKIRGAIGYVTRSRYREGVAKILLVIPAEEQSK